MMGRLKNTGNGGRGVCVWVRGVPRNSVNEWKEHWGVLVFKEGEEHGGNVG